ncbi:hypothetical protein D3C85_1262450 [compost metagenome]
MVGTDELKRCFKFADDFGVRGLLSVHAFFSTFEAAIGQASSVAGPVEEGGRDDDAGQRADLKCGHVV